MPCRTIARCCNAESVDKNYGKLQYVALKSVESRIPAIVASRKLHHYSFGRSSRYFFVFCIGMMLLLVRGASRLSPTHGDSQYK